MARMMGKTERRMNCRVPGHGHRCRIVYEMTKKIVGRTGEKRKWQKQVTRDY